MKKYILWGQICPPYNITQWNSKGGNIMYDNFG